MGPPLGLFGRRRPQPSTLDKEREALRRTWEIHMEQMPPGATTDPALIALRAEVAELDVRGSRFVGAVLAGHAAGLKSPSHDADELAEKIAGLQGSLPPEAAAELDFQAGLVQQVSGLLIVAERIERLQAQEASASSASAARK